jgi:hypothetical protein
MRFFLPGIQDTTEAERLLQSMRQAAQQATRRVPTGRRIFAIQYWVGGKQFDAEVGKPLVQLGLRHDQEGETVIAILETRDPDSFLVFTTSKGFRKGEPIIVAQEDSFGTVDFDA